MRNLAEYVMRGRKQAIIVVLLLNFVPLMGWLSDATVALVTLRKGSKEGAILLLWAILPGVVLALAGYPQLWFYDVIGGTVLVYCLATVLRASNSWSLVLQVGLLIGLIMAAVLHVWLPELGVQWIKDLQIYLKGASERFSMPIGGMTQAGVVAQLIKVAIGIQVALLLLGDLFSLFVARWWQALLYNPTGLATELRGVRLGVGALALLVLIVVLSLAGAGFAIDSLPVVALPFMLAGLSLVHYLVALAQVSKLWLVGFYGVLGLLFPYITVMLILLALVDVSVNIRQRFRVT